MKLFSGIFREASAPIPPNPSQSTPPLGESAEIAAIESLPDGEALRKLAAVFEPAAAEPPTSPALQRAAQLRMARLIHEGAIEDPQLLTQLVAEGASSSIRQLAAELVSDPGQIRDLLKQVREKDKNVYRILKQKCDSLNAEERKATEIANEISAICATLERHSLRSYDALYTATFEHHANRWRTLPARPDATLEKRAAEALDRCERVIAEHLRQAQQQEFEKAARRSAHEAEQLALQASQEAAAAQAEAHALSQREAAAALEASRAALAEKLAAEEQLFRQIGGLIRKAQAALNDGHTQQAAGLRRAIEEKIKVSAAFPIYLSKALQQLDDKLNQFKQWKDYAVAPKRIELIEEMQSLVGSSEQPKLLAERIKSLQEEWRTISKGIASEAAGDWERFHQASQAAYRPCRDYFEAQAKLRQENLERRRAVLERLVAFEAAQEGESADWRLLISVLREAPLEWRRHSPVDRQAAKTLESDFDASMGRLQVRLDAWHEGNAQEKQALIKRAQHLLSLEDGREAIEAVKRLQSSWKEVGQARRDQEQALWNEFRAICDAVYQKRQQAFVDFNAGLEANKVKARALCEAAEQVATLSGAALIQGVASIAEWRAAFDALVELPRADARALQMRFERALERCQAQISQQQAHAAERCFTDLFAAALHVRAYEWAVVTQALQSEQDGLRQAAEIFIAGVERWPKGGLPVLREALAAANSKTLADVESGEKALRLLCIRCEILTETTTPPEDEPLRREYQVQRLMQGLGQGSHAGEGDWDAIALQWARIAAVSPGVRDILQRRFMHVWKQRPVIRPPQANRKWAGGERNNTDSHDRSRPARGGAPMRGGGRERSKSVTSR
jgi:Domain of Unknown Function (DUF349)